MNTMQEQNIRDFLIPALRSGAFHWGSNHLCVMRQDTEVATYCCLGVASYLAHPDGFRSHYGSIHIFTDPIVDDTSSTGLTTTMQRFYGLDEDGGFVVTDWDTVFAKPLSAHHDTFQKVADYPHETLVSMNDSGDFTFGEIATVIEYILDHGNVATFYTSGEGEMTEEENARMREVARKTLDAAVAAPVS